MHHNNDRRCWETLAACIKAVLWQQGYVVAQTSDPVNRGTINQGKRVSGPEGDNPPRSCVLVTASTGAKAHNLLQRVHEECYSDDMFRYQVLADHLAPWLRLRAQRAAAAPQLRSFEWDSDWGTPRVISAP